MDVVRTEGSMGGTIRVPRPSIRRSGSIRRIVDGIVSLLKGMAVTFRYLSHPSTVVTRQYPENRETLKMYDRYRAQLVMLHDEQGYHKCTACRQCVLACPNASIAITTRKGAVTGRNEIDQYIWRHDSCTFCNACVIVCPFGALEMSPKFESAVFDRRLLVYNLNRYAGPPANALQKVTDPEQRKSMMEPRGVYSGPVPLNGVSLAGANADMPEPGPNGQGAPAASGQKEQG
jgi:formate hydrogenlyase subunit 6/NADH:ubiquinone oxidoreductase subunit I